MAANDSKTMRSQQPMPPSTADFARSSKQHINDMINLQREFSTYLQEVNHDWVAHMQSEASLASKFATKLSTARSVPETASICQEWTNQRMELLADDSRRFLANTEKLMETGIRAIASGWGATT